MMKDLPPEVVRISYELEELLLGSVEFLIGYAPALLLGALGLLLLTLVGLWLTSAQGAGRHTAHRHPFLFPSTNLL